MFDGDDVVSVFVLVGREFEGELIREPARVSTRGEAEQLSGEQFRGSRPPARIRTRRLCGSG